MAGRYLITGVQLGMLSVYVESENKDKEQILPLLKQIKDKQFVGNSTKDVRADIEDLDIINLFNKREG